MSSRSFAACLLFCASLPVASQADAAESTYPLVALQATAMPLNARYELGAVVDVRQANRNGVTILAITPGGAADRIGLRAGDQLRSVNGRRFDHNSRPSSTLDSALQEKNGALEVEAMRNGKMLVLSGRADAAPTLPAAKNACGYVTAQAGIVPRTQNIFRSEITQIDGTSTPLQPIYRHRVGAGKHVLVVREFIDESRLNSAQILQIQKMKRLAFARAYKSIVVDVEPGMSYRIGARLVKDRLDTQSIRDNAYWEPVVWEKLPEACP